MLRIVLLIISITWLTLVSHVDAEAPRAPNYTQVPLLGGTRTLRADRWTLIGFEVGNPGDKSVELVSTSYFAAEPKLQYGSAVWVPPHAKRRGWFPIRAPGSLSESANYLDLHSLLIDRSSLPEKVLPGPNGTLHRHGLLGVSRAPVVTGMMQNSSDDGPRHAVAAARNSRNLTIALPDLYDESLPPVGKVVEGLDQLVISNDDLLGDATALAAIRQWLHGGGRVWIMLDKVSPATVHQLLGARFRWERVDDVLLDEVTLVHDQPRPGEDPPLPRAFEDPLQFVRIMVADGDVAYSINGWPAALWCNVGHGQVLVTTLEARGWYREWNSADRPRKDVLKTSSYSATNPLKVLAETFLKPRKKPTNVGEAFGEMVSEGLGHEVLPMRFVALVLGGFCASLVGLTLVLVRFGGTAIMGVLSPALALLTAVIIGTAGLVSHRATPQSMAIGQQIEVDDHFSTFHATGVVSLYNQEQWEAPTGSDGGGVFVHGTGEATGSILRMVWTDVDRWRWENLTLPSGAQSASFSCSVPADSPVRARATLNEEGIVIDFDPGSLSPIRDGLLLAPGRRVMQTHDRADGTLLAGVADLLPPGQYATGTLVSADQRLQQTVLRTLLAEDNLWPSDDLVLLGWTEPLDLPFVLNDPETHAGSALLTVPVALTRPAAKTRVAVPSSLVRYRTIAGDRGTVSPAYSNRDRKWVEQLVTATRANLRIDLPPVLLPMKVDHISVTLNMVAPQREVTILGKNTNSDDQSDVVLWRTQSPVGTARADIKPDEAWQVASPGDLTLVLSIGEHPHQEGGAGTQAGWHIDDLSLDVAGTILSR